MAGDRLPAGGSFRDPAGRLVPLDGRLLRLVFPDAVADLERFLASRTAARLSTSGALVPPAILPEAEARALLDALPRVDGEPEPARILEHEPLPFVSYPHEWPPEMLHAAGELTLDLARSLVEEGLGLKDATPYNVLFRGASPVFVDWLSVESADPGRTIWLPYAQFVRTFLLPLLAGRHLGVSLASVFTTRRDGLEPAEVYRMCDPLRRMSPPFLGLVSLPTWLAAGADRPEPPPAAASPSPPADAERARFILRTLLGGLQRALAGVRPAESRGSRWSGYMETHSYAREQFAAKEAFVREALAAAAPEWVLDVGCNTGHFSALAARCGARVVGIDSDEAAVGQVWRLARRERLDVLPLVVDLARPSPAVGWRNRECASFLDRARGRFDLVLLLAVVHHLLVTERVPLPEILSLAAELTRRWAVVEYVGPDDPQFRRLARTREHLWADLTPERFEAALAGPFAIRRAQTLAGSGRRLYLLEKR